MSVEVEVNADGQLRSLEPGKTLPLGKAILIWHAQADHSSWLLSEAALAEDWLRPEDHEAWAYLQPAK